MKYAHTVLDNFLLKINHALHSTGRLLMNERQSKVFISFFQTVQASQKNLI